MGDEIISFYLASFFSVLVWKKDGLKSIHIYLYWDLAWTYLNSSGLHIFEKQIFKNNPDLKKRMKIPLFSSKNHIF